MTYGRKSHHVNQRDVFALEDASVLAERFLVAMVVFVVLAIENHNATTSVF